MLTTTLNKIVEHQPNMRHYRRLAKVLEKTEADDEEINFITLSMACGPEFAIWALRTLDANYDRPIQNLACLFAQEALRYACYIDDVCLPAIDAAVKFAKGHPNSDIDYLRARCYDRLLFDDHDVDLISMAVLKSAIFATRPNEGRKMMSAADAAFHAYRHALSAARLYGEAKSLPDCLCEAQARYDGMLIAWLASL